MKINHTAWLKYILATILVLVLNACGNDSGSNGMGNAIPTAGSNTWDELVWGNGHWN